MSRELYIIALAFLILASGCVGEEEKQELELNCNIGILRTDFSWPDDHFFFFPNDTYKFSPTLLEGIGSVMVYSLTLNDDHLTGWHFVSVEASHPSSGDGQKIITKITEDSQTVSIRALSALGEKLEPYQITLRAQCGENYVVWNLSAKSPQPPPEDDLETNALETLCSQQLVHDFTYALYAHKFQLEQTYEPNFTANIKSDTSYGFNNTIFNNTDTLAWREWEERWVENYQTYLDVCFLIQGNYSKELAVYLERIRAGEAEP